MTDRSAGTSIQPILLRSLAEEAFAKVVAAITSGEFGQGERISELDLARRLGISRGPLREALMRLEGRLVVRTARQGVRVILLSSPEIRGLFEVREALEGMAARLAAERMTDVELADLERLLSSHAEPVVVGGQPYREGTEDEDFHFRIIRGARNEKLERMVLDEIYYQIRMWRLKSGSDPTRAKVAFQEHREIVQALATGVPSQAEEAMRAHLRNALASVMRNTG